MAIATLSIDLEAKLANLERDFSKASRLAEDNARKMKSAYSDVGKTFESLGATLAGNESEHVDGKKASLSLADNLAFITNVIKKHNAEPILMTYHFQVKYVYANDVIRKVSDGLNIKRIELHKAILAVCKPFLCPQLLFSDLHPNVAGQIFIADQVKVFMEAVLQSKSQLEPSVSGSIE